jgi:nucleotide-binding universal stress UspA family protein
VEGRTTLVVGFDRSAAGLAALATAADLGERLGADLHVVHAVDLSDYPIDPDGADWEQLADTTLEDERRTVSDTLAGYPCTWTYEAARGNPTRALTRAADDSDALLIVVGAHSTGWRHLLQRLSGAPVCDRLLGHSRRPVVVVGHPT